MVVRCNCTVQSRRTQVWRDVGSFFCENRGNSKVGVCRRQTQSPDKAVRKSVCRRKREDIIAWKKLSSKIKQHFRETIRKHCKWKWSVSRSISLPAALFPEQTALQNKTAAILDLWWALCLFLSADKWLISLLRVL